MRPPDAKAVRSSAEFATLPPVTEGVLPQGFAQPDYATKALLFLEYVSIRSDLHEDASIGIEKIESNTQDNSHVVFAEFCRFNQRRAFAHVTFSRPYGFFETSAFNGSIEIRWTERTYPACTAIPDQVLVPIGMMSELMQEGPTILSRTGESDPPQRLVSNEEGWDFMIRRIYEDPDSIEGPPDFRDLDLNILYLQGKPDRGDGYVRLKAFRSTLDRSRHEFEAEYCGVEEGSGATHVPYALYYISPLPGEVTIKLDSKSPPDCLTHR